MVLKMLICLLAVLAVRVSAAGADEVDEALSSFERLESYKVTLRSDAGEVIRYFFKKPGHIRMEFEHPHKGAVLIFDPMNKEVRLRPFSFWKSFEMRLKPEDSLIKSERGHTVDESDIGSLLKNVKRLRDNGLAEADGQEDVGNRKAYVVEVKGEGSFTTADGVNRYRLWLDESLKLPVKVQAWSTSGTLLEEVLMDDLEVDSRLPMDLFS